MSTYDQWNNYAKFVRDVYILNDRWGTLRDHSLKRVIQFKHGRVLTLR